MESLTSVFAHRSDTKSEGRRLAYREYIREAECLSITKVILQVPEYNRKDVHITTGEEMKNYQL
jgi:hypothetical protein